MCACRAQGHYKYAQGFFAEQLHQVLESLPPHVWHERRRKRSYVNQVLARGEVASGYEPARRLWARTGHGHYLPNPAMHLRRGEDWTPVYEAMNLEWVDLGTGGEAFYWPRPARLVARLREAAQCFRRMRACAAAPVS